MDPSSANIVAYVVIGLGMVLLGAYVMRILGGGRGATRRNDAFLARAVVAQELPPGEVVAASFQSAAGGAHAVWLDLSLAAPGELAFELWLAVRVGDATLLEGTYPVTFDEERDAHGLPSGDGTTALSSYSASMPGSERVTTVLRACRFDAPAGAAAEVRARIVPGAHVTLRRARLLVTPGEAPGSVEDGDS